MTTLVLLILGAVWAAVLVPPALRARAEANPGDSVGSWHHQLNTLRRTGGYAPVPTRSSPHGVGVPPAPVVVNEVSLARKRRRDVLVTLLGIMGLTLVGGMLPAFRGLLYLHVVADVLFAGYIVLLLQIKKTAAQRVEAERARKVTQLRRRLPPEGVADLALRRAASR